MVVPGARSWETLILKVLMYLRVHWLELNILGDGMVDSNLEDLFTSQ